MNEKREELHRGKLQSISQIFVQDATPTSNSFNEWTSDGEREWTLSKTLQ